MRGNALVVGGASLAATSLVLSVVGWWLGARIGIASGLVVDSRSLVAVMLGAVVVVGVSFSALAATRDGGDSRRGALVLAVLIAVPLVALAVSSLRRIDSAADELARAQAATPYAAYAAALVSASGALVVAVGGIASGDHGPATTRAVVVVALATAVTAGTLSGLWILRASQEWQPKQTSVAAPIAAVPGSLGRELYRVPLGLSRWDDVIPAGNGFVLRGWSSLVGYDGPTGRIRWEVDGLRWGQSSAVTWRSWEDRTGLAVFAKERSLVALDAGTGKVAWARLLPDKIGRVIGGTEALGISLDGPGQSEFMSIDPATGRTLWSKAAPVERTAARGQFYVGSSTGEVIDARSGDRVDGVSGRVLTSETYLVIERLAVIDRAGRRVDTLPREIFDRARSYRVEASGNGMVLFRVWTDDSGPRLYLRDTRVHAEIPIPAPPAGVWDSGQWIGNKLLLASRSNSLDSTAFVPSETRMEFTPATGALAPSEARPCGNYERPGTYLPVAGAVLALCGSSTSAEIVGTG